MTDALKHKQKSTYDSEESDEYYTYDDIEDEATQLIKEKKYQRQLLKHQTAGANIVRKSKGVSFGFSNNMRESSGEIRHGRGRGHSDPPEPSQYYTSPAAPPPPPPPHTSFSPGITNFVSGFNLEIIPLIYGL